MLTGLSSTSFRPLGVDMRSHEKAHIFDNLTSPAVRHLTFNTIEVLGTGLPSGLCNSARCAEGRIGVGQKRAVVSGCMGTSLVREFQDA